VGEEMGLNREFITYIEKCIHDALGGMQGRSMLELGNQDIDVRSGIQERLGKDYFCNRGIIEHVSIDLNGEDGALAYDLARPIDRREFIGRFDVITNAGTSEHVEPIAGQYTCFQNIHNMLAVGGIAIHIVPDVEELDLRGSWKNHSNNYYSKEFFLMLADENAYRLLSSIVLSGLRCVCLQKTVDAPFMQNRDLLLAKISRRSGGIVYAGINDGKRRLVPLFMRRCKAVGQRLLPPFLRELDREITQRWRAARARWSGRP
jgi:hypothetical protein